MIQQAAVVEVRNRVHQILAAMRDLPADERQLHLEYLAGSAWRYAVTLQHVQRAWRRPMAGLRVIDIGAYPGHLAALLCLRESAIVQAITLIQSPAVEAEMQRLGIAVSVCDVEREPLPADDGSIQLVLCCELIEHLVGDVRHMLVEAHRVLAPDGVFMLTTPNHASVKHRWELLRGRSVWPPLNDPLYPFYAGAGQRNPWRHVREFTVTEIRSLLHEAGFGHVDVTTQSPPFQIAGLSLRGFVSSALLQAAELFVPAGGTLILATARC